MDGSEFSSSVTDHVARAEQRQQTLSMSSFLSELQSREALHIPDTSSLPVAAAPGIDTASSVPPYAMAAVAANSMQAQPVTGSPFNEPPYVANTAESVGSEHEMMPMHPEDNTNNEAVGDAHDSLGLVVAVSMADPVPALALADPECIEVLCCIFCCPCQCLAGI